MWNHALAKLGPALLLVTATASCTRVGFAPQGSQGSPLDLDRSGERVDGDGRATPPDRHQVLMEAGSLAYYWFKKISASGPDVVADLAVDGAGNLYVTGHKVEGSTAYSFLESYSPDGGVRFAKLFGGSDGQTWAAGIAVDAGGNVCITGWIRGSISFGGSLLSADPTLADCFVACYDSTGAHRWSTRYGGTSTDTGHALAFDGNGNLYLAGSFGASIIFANQLTSVGGSDIFLVSFGPGGSPRWSKGFGGAYADSGTAVTIDSTGNVALAGYYQGSASFGPAPAGVHTSKGNNDVFVALFSPAGSYLWSRSFGGPGSDLAMGLASADSQLYVVGYFNGTADFSGKTLVSAGLMDAFLAALSPSGALNWSRPLGGPGNDRGHAVTADGAGRVYAAGSFEGSMKLGADSLAAAGATDIFLAVTTADGSVLKALRFGGAAADDGIALAHHGASLYLGGSFGGTADFGGGPVAATGTSDGFVVKLER